MRNDVIVGKMLAYIDKILRYTDQLNYADFLEKNSQIPWKQIYGLRNRIVHDYEGVNLQLVWQIVQEDLPELREELQNL